MNLLFFHYSMQAGGAERTIALLSNYVAIQGNNVTIVTMDDLPSFYKLHKNVKHIKLNINRESKNFLFAIIENFLSLPIIKETYKSCQPDTVICFGPNSILLTFLARRKLKYKIVGTERANPYLNIKGFWGKSKKMISTLCDGFIFQTHGAKKYYPPSVRKKSIVLPNSISRDQFVAADRSLETRSDICTVGRLDANKCFDDLIIAFAKVNKEHPDVNLHIYGDGPLRMELEALASHLGLNGSVIFHGQCNTMYSEYFKYKIFALSSKSEGMPNVLMEALASGCACVSTNCDFGPSELISNGINGFLVPVHNTSAMSDAICHLLENDSLCQKISNAALSIRQTHDIETIGNIFCDYLKII